MGSAPSASAPHSCSQRHDPTSRATVPLGPHQPFQVCQPDAPGTRAHPVSLRVSHSTINTQPSTFSYSNNPSDGRWLSRDPVGEKSAINLYGFVNGAPTNTTDMDGRDRGTICPRCGEYYIGACSCGYPNPPAGTEPCGQFVMRGFGSTPIIKPVARLCTFLCTPHEFIVTKDGTRLENGGEAAEDNTWFKTTYTIQVPNGKCGDFTACVKKYIQQKIAQGYAPFGNNCHVAEDAIRYCGGYMRGFGW